MFAGGGQPVSSAGGVAPDSIETDAPTNAFFAFGRYGGVPRVLDLMDKGGIRLSSLMIGKVVETSLGLVRKIGRRGRDEGATQRRAENNDQFLRDRRVPSPKLSTIRNGHRPKADRLGRLLASQLPPRPGQLGKSRLAQSQRRAHARRAIHCRGAGIRVRDAPVCLPRERRRLLPFQAWNRAAYQEALRDEFDQVYDEGVGCGRMMVLCLHDRVFLTGLPRRTGQ